MNKQLFILVTAFILLFVTESSEAQRSKFGKIDINQLKMDSYPEDADAAAVILLDRAEVTFSSNLTMFYETHVRIKILNKSAFDDWGSVEIPFTGSLKQKVRDIEAVTYNLDEKGKIKKDKVGKKDIFEEKVQGKVKVKKFTFKNLQVGSIIEYKYKIRGEFGGYIPPWTFQSSEPVIWSEYRVKLPDFLSYTLVQQGIVGYDIETKEKFRDPIERVDGTIYTWAISSIPAFRDEPHMTARKDYLMKLDLHLHSYILGGYKTVLLDSWNTVASDLLSDNQFGGAMKIRGKGKDALKAIMTELGPEVSKLDKLIAIYDYVRTNTRWNSRNSIWAHESGSDYVLKGNEGDTGDINFLLIALLKEAGFEANPILASTRANGKVIEHVPLRNQFNIVLAEAKIGTKSYVMDATSQLRSYDMLPSKTLNGRGLRISKSNPSWIKLQSGAKHKRVVLINAELSEEGRIKGTLNNSSYSYAGIKDRRALELMDAEEYVYNNLMKDWDESEIDSLIVSNVDSVSAPIKTQVDFTRNEAAVVANDFIYLDHMLVDKLEENPYKLESRSFPVDRTFATNYQYILNLDIPDGYEVAEMPENKRVNHLNGGITLTRRIQEADGRVTVHVKLDYKRSIYLPSEYAEFRAFHDEVISIQGEQIVLKKKVG